jgi:uncharacterized iron-regulated membrane protein
VRRSKEIIILLALLAAAMIGVLGYVIRRKAELRAAPPPPPAVKGPLAPASTAAPAAPVDLAAHDRQVIDFSSGKPVVQDTPEDRAALQAGLKDIADATRDVTFEPPKPAAPKR